MLSKDDHFAALANDDESGATTTAIKIMGTTRGAKLHRRSFFYFTALGLAVFLLWGYDVRVVRPLMTTSSTSTTTEENRLYGDRACEKNDTQSSSNISVSSSCSNQKLPQNGNLLFVVPAATGGEQQQNNAGKRWTGQDLLNHFEKLGLAAEMSLDLLPLLPKPRGDDVKIYSMPAWQRLNELLLSQSNRTRRSVPAAGEKDTIVLCAMGGSFTAGGGCEKRMRYGRVFAEDIMAAPTNASHWQVNIHFENLGHGGQTTYRSAYSMINFLPENTDILIWEHSANDDPMGDSSCEVANNGLILFLNRVREVSALSNTAPPLVILLYFWDADLWLDYKFARWSLDGKIPGRTFRCHNDLAASYDFVVGSVDVGSYLNHLEWNATSIRTWFRPRGGDKVHPNERANWMTAFLLWHFVTDNSRVVPASSPSSSVVSRQAQPPLLNFTCNLQDFPPASQKIADILIHNHVLASWTNFRPRNEEHRQGMIYPLHYYPNNKAPDSDLTLAKERRIYGGRIDRFFSFLLPCCSNGESLAFDFSSSGALWISALQLMFHKVSFPDLLERVQVRSWDSSGRMLWNTTTSTADDVDALVANGSAAAVPVWSFLPKRDCSIESWTWLILPNKTPVSRIDFCNSKCSGKEDTTISDLILY